MRQIREPKCILDIADLFHGVFVSIFAKLLLLNLFELVAHLIELLLAHRVLPGGKDDGIFARGVVLIHQDKSLQSFCQRLSVHSAQFRALRHRQNVVGDLASAIVLGYENVGQTGCRTTCFSDCRKDVSLFQLLFVIILAERAK